MGMMSCVWERSSVWKGDVIMMEEEYNGLFHSVLTGWCSSRFVRHCTKRDNGIDD